MGFRQEWIRLKTERRYERDLTSASSAESMDFMALDRRVREKIIRDAIQTDVSAALKKWMPLMETFFKLHQQRKFLAENRSKPEAPST
jgi:hypothetical protein